MKSKERIRSGLAIFLMVIFTIMVIFPVTQINAFEDTYQITQTADDGWTIRTGIGFNGPLVAISDPNQDIIAHLHFREIDLNSWERVENATLRITAAGDLTFDADTTITVYGVAQADLQGLSGNAIYGPDAWLNFPLTTAHTNVNISLFYGGVVIEIDVTAIVDELHRNPGWDGSGLYHLGTGDDMAFKILGAAGGEIRYFYDYGGDPARSADLVIHHSIAPPPPDGGSTWEYRNQSQGWDIWFDPYEPEWLNFSTFTQVGASPKEGGITDYQFTVTNMYGDSDSYMRRDFDLYRNDTDPVIGIKMGLNITGLPWSVTNDYVTLWSFGNSHEPASKVDEGYTFTLRSETTQVAFLLWGTSASGLTDSSYYLPTVQEAWLPWVGYFNITFDMSTGVYTCKLYNTSDMITEEFSYTDTLSTFPPWGGGGWLEYEYVNGPFSLPGAQLSGWSGDHLSIPDEGGLDEWYVVPPNSTTPQIVPDMDGDGDIDRDDAELLISELTQDPEDPDPGGGWGDGPFSRFNTRFYILMMGFALIWGPVMYLGYVKPGGYQFVIGAFVIMVGFAFLIAAGSV